MFFIQSYDIMMAEKVFVLPSFLCLQRHKLKKELLHSLGLLQAQSLDSLSLSRNIFIRVDSLTTTQKQSTPHCLSFSQTHVFS